MSGHSIDPNSVALKGSDGSHSTNIGGSYGYGLVGVRIGYSIDRALIYVKSGAVFTSTQAGFTDACNTGACGPGLLSTTKQATDTGYGLGAGIEYALPFEWSNNVSIKTEYLYFGINSTQTSSGSNAFGDIFTTTDKISGIHTAKIGVNYKFQFIKSTLT